MYLYELLELSSGYLNEIFLNWGTSVFCTVNCQMLLFCHQSRISVLYCKHFTFAMGANFTNLKHSCTFRLLKIACIHQCLYLPTMFFLILKREKVPSNGHLPIRALSNTIPDSVMFIACRLIIFDFCYARCYKLSSSMILI